MSSGSAWAESAGNADLDVRLAALSAASASTTVLLSIAVIASAAMVGGLQPSRPFGALLVGFMITGAAGAAIPTDPRPCAAIVDRLTFGANIIETGSDSYRLAHARTQRAIA